MIVKNAGKIFFLFLFSVLALALDPFGNSAAEKRYVSDILTITLRQGPGAEHEAIKTLKSDAQLDVIEEKDPFLKVRTAAGEEGWVPSKYTTTDTPKTIIISQLENKIRQLETKGETAEKQKTNITEEAKAIKTDCATMKEEYESSLITIKEELQKKEKELEALNDTYKTLYHQSQNVAELIEKNKNLGVENGNLNDKNKSLLIEVEQLRKENATMRMAGLLKWFLSGVGVFLIGVILGIFSKKNRTSYY